MVAPVSGAEIELHEMLNLQEDGKHINFWFHLHSIEEKNSAKGVEVVVCDSKRKFCVAKHKQNGGFISKQDDDGGKPLIVIFSSKKDALRFLRKAGRSPEEYSIFPLRWNDIINVFQIEYKMAALFCNDDDTLSPMPFES